MSIIYLWDNTQGWHHHNTDDVGVLKEHGVSIGARASIGDGASIGYGASIGARAKPKIIYIFGSAYPVSYWGEDRIDIGCHHKPIAWWYEHGENVGRKECFTDEQIEEYRRYVDMIAAIHGAVAAKEDLNE